MHTTYKALVLILLSACFSGSPSYGQEAPDSKTRLMQFAANNSGFDQKVTAQAKTLFASQIDDCKAPEKFIRQLPTPYGDLTFPQNTAAIQFPAPTKGLWTEHFKVKGCGKVWTINMLAVARDKAPPTLLALLAGDTLSDPATQSTTERTGAQTIKKADAETCAADAEARYTKFLGYKQASNTLSQIDAGQGWFEEWSYRFCQQTIPVQMAFLPNTKGGIDVKARIVPSVMPQIPQAKPATPASNPSY